MGNEPTSLLSIQVAITSCTASFASAMDCGISTPLPAAMPLAFTTNSRPARYSSYDPATQKWRKHWEFSEIVHPQSMIMVVWCYYGWFVQVGSWRSVDWWFLLEDVLPRAVRWSNTVTAPQQQGSCPRHISVRLHARPSWKSSSGANSKSFEDKWRHATAHQLHIIFVLTNLRKN